MREERFCDVGRGISLCYDEFGDPSDPPLLLVMGLATQMIAWHEDFCEGLAERGFHVVRFDNRDIGRSTHMDFRPPTPARCCAGAASPEPVHALRHGRATPPGCSASWTWRRPTSSASRWAA